MSLQSEQKSEQNFLFFLTFALYCDNLLKELIISEKLNYIMNFGSVDAYDGVSGVSFVYFCKNKNGINGYQYTEITAGKTKCFPAYFHTVGNFSGIPQDLQSVDCEKNYVYFRIYLTHLSS